MLKLLHNAMTNISKTNWDKLDALSESEIDVSDIPPLTEDFFSRAGGSLFHQHLWAS
jgi:hypothetical protein